LDRGGQSSKLGTRSERVGSERSEEIVYYYCGCPHRSALISNPIEGFEVASNQIRVSCNSLAGNPGDRKNPDN
jgi:hypothetical protein